MANLNSNFDKAKYRYREKLAEQLKEGDIIVPRAYSEKEPRDYERYEVHYVFDTQYDTVMVKVTYYFYEEVVEGLKDYPRKEKLKVFELLPEKDRPRPASYRDFRKLP